MVLNKKIPSEAEMKADLFPSFSSWDLESGLK